MPTGWRPEDVTKKIPRTKVENVYSQEKYKPEYKLIHKIFAGFHFVVQNIILFVFLTSFADISVTDKTAYLILIFSTIFSSTSVMDGFKWSTTFEFLRIFIGIAIIVLSQELNLTYNLTLATFLLSYFAVSAILNLLLSKSVRLGNS